MKEKGLVFVAFLIPTLLLVGTAAVVTAHGSGEDFAGHHEMMEHHEEIHRQHHEEHHSEDFDHEEHHERHHGEGQNHEAEDFEHCM